MSSFELSTYQGKPAIFDKDSRCFVLFGNKSVLKKRVKELNEEKSETNLQRRQKTFTANLLDNSNYEKLKRLEGCLSQHSYNAPTYYYVSDSAVSICSVHGTISFEEAKESLEWFLEGIPYKEII